MKNVCLLILLSYLTTVANADTFGAALREADASFAGDVARFLSTNNLEFVPMLLLAVIYVLAKKAK